MTEALTLAASNVSLGYGDGDLTTFAVRDISLSIDEPGYYGVIGPSGSGKSSLLYLLSGLKRPTSGSVTFAGRKLADQTEAERSKLRREQFGFVFQQPFLLNFLTALENVQVAARPGDTNAANKVTELLEELGIAHLASRYPTHLSGGERQRVVVARAMVNSPSIIFADEPTAALDHKNGTAVIELLKRYRAKGSVIVVTHDPTMLAGADRIYHLSDGQLSHVQVSSEVLRAAEDAQV